MSLEFYEITRDRIYNRQGKCGRKDPRPAARNGRPQTNTQPVRAKFSYPLPSCGHEEIARTGICDSPLLLFWFFGTSTSFSPSRLSTLRVRSRANVRRNHENVLARLMLRWDQNNNCTSSLVRTPEIMVFARRLGRWQAFVGDCGSQKQTVSRVDLADDKRR